MAKNRRHDIVKPSKFKTSMCTFFMSEEGCPFGDKCAFAHGEDELRAEPKEGAPVQSTAQPEVVAATSSPTSSHTSEHGTGASGAADKGSHANSSPGKRGHQDPSGSNAATNAKCKTKKNRMDVATNSAASPGSTHDTSRGKPDATHARCRPQRERRALPPPLPMQSQGPMPSAAYNLSVAPNPPTAYALYGDLSMAYGGIPAIPGMPYYIPTVGNHPFSNINNNHHAVNVVPHMQSPIPYTTSAPPPLTFPPTQPQTTPAPPTSVTNSSMTLNQNVGSSKSSTTAAEESRRRPRQPVRHVVSSNMMAHTHSRYTSSAASAAPAEVASPQYIYGLMAASGVPQSGSPMPAAATSSTATTAAVSTSEEHRRSGNASLLSTPPHQQKPRLIVVPHKSGSGGFMVPSNIRNYHPPSTVGPTSPAHSTFSTRGETAVTAASSVNCSSGFSDVDVATNSFQQLKASPVPPTVVHIPLSSVGSDLTCTSGGKVSGDALWGPADDSLNPLTRSALPISVDDGASGGDYNALLSGLGIGGSSYTTIPLEELVRQHGTARDEDDIGFGGDFDWTGVLERWMQMTKEESAAAADSSSINVATPAAATTKKEPVLSTAPSVKEPTSSSVTAATHASSPTYLPQASRPVTSALNHKPVLMEGEGKPRVPATAEGKRKLPMVCHVSRVGGKPVPPKRRAPVMTNQFKSSCAAEAESGSVLLYCAEKNTLVYITSASGKATPTACAHASRTGVVRANEESDTSAAAAAAPARTMSPNSPATAGSALGLGLGVRFNPGRKKFSVLASDASDDDVEYYI
ncbi:putative zinc finger (CCCH type) protein [Leptomonas seymouri]|uniref:Putative zinc finger (CCCH type) protein n=1 Tax=Leptomonas seymouri TaxID=5684 RepID=A0A0N0P4Y8_LEPSE|nr:putative zinc finger (CCCH type) protein [Leptomonas seymouri]|eukprot:KPI85846.1 putative zinc finger (CCCH type) protein [Leptomonas seymouri]